MLDAPSAYATWPLPSLSAAFHWDVYDELAASIQVESVFEVLAIMLVLVDAPLLLSKDTSIGVENARRTSRIINIPTAL
jgi:hypothetical protein